MAPLTGREGGRGGREGGREKGDRKEASLGVKGEKKHINSENSKTR